MRSVIPGPNIFMIWQNNVTGSPDFAVEITPISISAGASPQTPTELTTLPKASYSAY